MHYSDPRGRGKEQSLFKETMAENFDNPGKEKKSTQGSRESSKTDECKESHVETHYNYKSKKTRRES